MPVLYTLPCVGAHWELQPGSMHVIIYRLHTYSNHDTSVLRRIHEQTSDESTTKCSLPECMVPLSAYRREAASTAKKWNLWNNVVSYEGSSGSNFYEQTSKAKAKAKAGAGAGEASSDPGADSNVGGDKESKGIASLAARAARASRTWKVYQEVERAKRQPLQLSSSDDN